MITLELDRGRCAKRRWAKTYPADCNLMLITNRKRLRLHACESVTRRRGQTVRVLELSSEAVPIMIDNVMAVMLVIDRRVAERDRRMTVVVIMRKMKRQAQ